MKKVFLSLAVLLSCATMANAQFSYGVRAGYNYSTMNVSVEGVSANINPGMKHGFYVGGVGNIGLGDKLGLQYELNYLYSGMKVSLSEDFFTDVITEDWTGGKATANYTTHNINVPIMLKLSSNNLSVMAGPYVSFVAASKTNLNNNVMDFIEGSFDEEDAKEAMDEVNAIIDYSADVIKSNLLRLDAGLALGVEYQFANNLFVEARYNFSVLNNLKKEISLPYPDNDILNGGASKSDWEDNMGSIDIKDELGIMPTVKNQFIQVGIGFRF